MREPGSVLKPSNSLGWAALVTIPESGVKTFGSGKKYLKTEVEAQTAAAKSAVEWLLEQGHLKPSAIKSFQSRWDYRVGCEFSGCGKQPKAESSFFNLLKL